MELNDKVTQLEDEIKILKNEVQAVLLDLRESYLNNENPFNPNKNAVAVQPMIAPVIMEQPAAEPKKPKPEPEETEEPEDELPEEEETPEAPEEEFEEEPEPEEVKPAPAKKKSRAIVAEEPESIPEAENEIMPDAFENTAQEEVTRVWHPGAGPSLRFKEGEAPPQKNGKKPDLEVIQKLAQWDRFVHKPEAEVPEKVSTREYLAAIIEFNSLLGKEDKSEIAMLYILCQENDNR